MTQDGMSEPTPTVPRAHDAAPHPRRRPRWSDYTAFVFSTGGARGALQVGELRALFEFGETPDVVVGTSIGSWNGALVARDPTPRVIEELTGVWRGLTTSRVLLGWEPRFPPMAPAYTGAYVVAAMRRVTMGFPSLYGDAGLRGIFAEHLAGWRFEDLAIPFRVMASNISTGEIAVFGHGPLEMALLASAAIPGVFPPVRINGQTFVDGGALESSGIDVAISLGARRIFVLDAGYDASPEADEQLQRLISRDNHSGHEPSPHALAVLIERTATMMGRYQLARALERIPPGIEAHIIRPTRMMGEATLDFDHAAQWIDTAYEHARDYLRDHVQPLPSAEPRREALPSAQAETPGADRSDSSDEAIQQRAG
jgi:NTE family protein